MGTSLAAGQARTAAERRQAEMITGATIRLRQRCFRSRGMVAATPDPGDFVTSKDMSLAGLND